MALAPWVLLPLVPRASAGRPRRAAALSRLAVACCGGVNAVAVVAVLPLGVLWLLTRAPGPRRGALLRLVDAVHGAGDAWWLVPLLLLGRYSPPFLDYIENATITTVPTGLARTLVGTSDWVAYFAGIDYQAGAAAGLDPVPHARRGRRCVALGLVGHRAARTTRSAAS